MRDPQEIKELEAQIARDKQKYSEIERLEDELLGNVPPEGFTRSYYDRKVPRRKGSVSKLDSGCRRDAGGSEKPAKLIKL